MGLGQESDPEKGTKGKGGGRKETERTRKKGISYKISLKFMVRN
jgi:hypothetical protein